MTDVIICCKAREKCPACNTESPCVNHDEVDVGVGVYTGNYCFGCPTHGEFTFGSEGVIFREGCTEHEDCDKNGLLSIECAMTRHAVLPGGGTSR